MKLCYGILCTIIWIVVTKGFSLNVTNVSHIHWNETSEYNCHGFKISFKIDFDLKKTDSIYIVWWNVIGRNETFPCKIVRNRHGVCALSFIESNKKDIWLLFYLNVLTKTSREKTYSNLTISSISNTKTAIMKTAFEKENSSRNNVSRLKPTSLLLKKYKYHLKYEVARGPLNIRVLDVTSTRVVIVWHRPWHDHCKLMYDTRHLLEDCRSIEGKPCGRSEIINVDENDICNFEKLTGLYTCQNSVEQLKPDTTYTIKLKYSSDFFALDHEKHWSDWSNTLKFTTLSPVPDVSLDIKCYHDSDDEYIISWQKPPKVSHIPTLFYRLETEDEAFNITNVQGKVSFKLLVTKKTMVRVLACSNSGCSNPYSQGTCKLDVAEKVNPMHYVIAGLVVVLLIALVFIAFVIWMRFNLHSLISICKKSRATGEEDNLVHPRQSIELGVMHCNYERPCDQVDFYDTVQPSTGTDILSHSC